MGYFFKKSMIKLPHYIQVADIIEFSRLVCAFERVPRTSFSFDLEGQHVISVQMDVLKEKPETNKELEVTYEPLELEDLTSLVKLSYGFEESPFPLFAFLNGTKWMVGVFMNFNESDELSYFCHVKLDNEPTKPFLKYSSKDGLEPAFVNTVSEHGYSYLKIIKLKDKHPL